MSLHIRAVYITTFLDRDNVTPAAIASASALFKSTCAQSYDASRGLGRPRYTAALYNAAYYYLLYYITARLYPLCVINTRIGELTRRHISAEKRREKDGVIGGLKTGKLIRFRRMRIYLMNFA